MKTREIREPMSAKQLVAAAEKIADGRYYTMWMHPDFHPDLEGDKIVKVYAIYHNQLDNPDDVELGIATALDATRAIIFSYKKIADMMKSHLSLDGQLTERNNTNNGKTTPTQPS